MRQKIKDYLPKEPAKTTLIQARVDEQVFQSVREVMLSKRLTWNELIEACLRKFLDEMGDSHDE